MNVDASSNVHAPAQTPKGAAGPTRSRPQGADAASDSGTNGFLSLLVSIGSPLSEPVADGVLPTDGPNGFAGAPANGPDQDLGLLVEQDADGRTAQDPAWLGATEAGDAGRLVADGAIAGAIVGTTVGARPGGPVTAPGRGLQGGVHAGADALGTALAVDEPPSQGDHTSLLASAATRKGTADLQSSAGTVPGLQDTGGTDSPRDLLARVQAAKVTTEANSTFALGAASSGNGVAQPQFASLFDAGAMNLRANTAWRSADRLGQRFGNAVQTAGMTAGAEAALPGTSHGASPVYAPGATTPVPAAAVADKVHYWVSRGVQNAELQLDAFDGGSVDVSISVKGHEALVEFRTDQPQARRLLLDAMPQLKELLESEGLMLSGGFVGNSAQDGPSQGREGQRQGGRDSRRHDLPAAGQLAPAARMTGAPGGAIDLFV